MAKAIKVENVSKAYQLGDFGSGSLARDLERYWARLRGREDPFLKIGEVNDRTAKSSSNMVWSLKDLNFTIEQGDAVGIIGRNGAGKSTLLKILSRVTSPTTGSIKVKGRIASLLEVGTGFHPELTGRENIFLNGAILGMRKAEIKRKFDEIVDFSGVERYIDTPVKRYSSGMYVRLAFAVAAYLESETLIIDEVLAVGDAEFQKKCLGKMKDVSRSEGRTVLFVSHNMGAVKSLCNQGLLLDNGMMHVYGTAEETIKVYNLLNQNTDADGGQISSVCERFTLERPFWKNDKNEKVTNFIFGEPITLCFDFFFKVPVKTINPGFAIVDLHDQRIFTSHLNDDCNFSFPKELIGEVQLRTKIDIPLSPGTYKLVYGVRDEFENTAIYSENVYLNIEDSLPKNGANGLLWYTTKWEVTT